MPLMLLFRSPFAYRAYRGQTQIIRCLPRRRVDAATPPAASIVHCMSFCRSFQAPKSEAAASILPKPGTGSWQVSGFKWPTSWASQKQRCGWKHVSAYRVCHLMLCWNFSRKRCVKKAQNTKLWIHSLTTSIQRTCPPLQSFPQSCGLAVWVETWTTLPTDVRTFTGISARDASAPIRQSMTGWVMWIAWTSGTWSAATAAITRKKSLMLSTNICLTSSASSSQTASTRWLLLN